MSAVTKACGTLKYVPLEFRTSDICKSAIANYDRYRSKNIFDSIPQNIITEELCKFAIKRNELALKALPLKFRTRDMYVTAIMCYPRLLRSMPKNMQGYEFYKSFVCNSNLRDCPLRYIPKKIITNELCELAILHHQNMYWSAFEFVPKKLITQELCELAINNHRRTSCDTILRRIPRKFFTHKLCDIAIKNGGSKIYIPRKFHNKIIQPNIH